MTFKLIIKNIGIRKWSPLAARFLSIFISLFSLLIQMCKHNHAILAHYMHINCYWSHIKFYYRSDRPILTMQSVVHPLKIKRNSLKLHWIWKLVLFSMNVKLQSSCSITFISMSRCVSLGAHICVFVHFLLVHFLLTSLAFTSIWLTIYESFANWNEFHYGYYVMVCMYVSKVSKWNIYSFMLIMLSHPSLPPFLSRAIHQNSLLFMMSESNV